MARDLMHAFASADIPVHKLEHPSIRELFTKYFTVNSDLPSTSFVRNQLSVLSGELFEKIKGRLKNKKVGVLADESSDTELRYFFQIMFVELDVFSECKPYLVDTVFLTEANFQTVSQAILKCLNKYCIDYENVLAYGSDNVAYMNKSWKAVLCNILTNGRHVTCNAHIISLVGDCFRDKVGPSPKRALFTALATPS